MPWKPIHPVIDGFRICILCERNLDISLFPKQAKSKYGIRPRCKECENAKNRAYYTKNSELIKRKQREFGKTEHRRKYARNYMREKLYRKNLERAGRERPLYCEICCHIEDRSIRHSWIVFDHCHKSNGFRGWICNRCNRVLGLCLDDPELLSKLSLYLRGFTYEEENKYSIQSAPRNE